MPPKRKAKDATGKPKRKANKARTYESQEEGESSSGEIYSTFTAMKNMLLSRDQICIFSDNFRTSLFKVYTRARYKQAKISQNKDDLKIFFVFVGIF